MARLSFIIPVYNAEKYLQECLDSIVCQTMQDIEIICINDGSSDSSLAILEKAASQDTRIRIFSVPNGGVSAARNQGLSHATGEYIWFVDADDYISRSDAAEKLYEKAVSTNADMVFLAYTKLDENTGQLMKSSNALAKFSEFSGAVSSNDLGEKSLSVPGLICMKLFSNSFLREKSITFDTSFKFYEDFLLFFKVMINNPKVAFLNESYYIYRVNTGKSATDNISKHYNDIFRVFEVTMQQVKQYSCNTEFTASYLTNRITGFLFWFYRINKQCKKDYYIRMRNIFLSINTEHGKLIRNSLPPWLLKKYQKVLRRPYWLYRVHVFFKHR